MASTKSVEMQNSVVQELFTAYFENEKDITSHEVLHDAAVKAGLKSEEVKGWLESDEGGESVDREVVEWAGRRRQISGVPHFIINGSAELGGAQDPEVFVEMFQELEARSDGGGSGQGTQASGITC